MRLSVAPRVLQVPDATRRGVAWRGERDKRTHLLIMVKSEWFLSAKERGNPATRLDIQPGASWSTGNTATPLVHGAVYFAELLHALGQLQPGDLVLFTDWRGDPTSSWPGMGPRRGQRSARPLSAASTCAASSGAPTSTACRSARRRTGTSVRRSKRPAGSACWTCGSAQGGSHHQKFVVLRHPGRPNLDVA